VTSSRIPDPFVGTKELDVEWVGERMWTYRTSFPSPEVPPEASVFLLFDGLDTIAKVRLNGREILESDNMFLSYRVNVTDVLRLAGQENELSIDFDSALLHGRQLEKEHPEHRFIAHNGEKGRIGVRKAQYHWVCLSKSKIDLRRN
jgi:beta-mannosidase